MTHRPPLPLRRLTHLLALAAALTACGGSAPGDPSSPPPVPPAPTTGTLTITSIAPASGPTDGATAVTVDGTGFGPGTQVLFGGVEASLVSVSGPSRLVAVAPPHAAGAVDVQITTASLETATVAGAYAYVQVAPPAPVPQQPPPTTPPPTPTPPPPAAPPVVAAINVHGSPQAGGGLLLFAGTGLENAASVTFGGAAATGLTYDPVKHTLLVTIPPCPLGPTADAFVDLVVTNQDGQLATVPGFHYGNPPAASGFTPDLGPKGTTVVISGADFSADASGARAGLQVSFGGVTAATMVNKSATEVTVTVPKLNPGSYQVVVVNFDGQYSVAPGTFTVPGP